MTINKYWTVICDSFYPTPMQEVTPRVVPTAVSMLISNCRMNFQVSFFIAFLIYAIE